MKRKNITKLWTLALLAGMLFTSCSDWTEVERVDHKSQRPSEQDPALWEQYLSALNEYKKSEHTMVFAGFANGAKVATSEKDCLRSLPDSLDVVLLTNGDGFSEYDEQDLPVLKEKGIRAVYCIDYAARAAEWADLAALGSYIDRVIARVGELNLDGFSFSGTPVYGTPDEQAAQQAVAALFIEKLAAVAGPGKELLLLFEGDPQFLTAADRAKIDYFLLDTSSTDNATQLKLQVRRALDALQIPAEKLLLSTQTDFEFIDEDKKNSVAIPAVTLRVTELGPLGGMCIYGSNMDYFGAEFIYPLTRNAIQTLNPSK